MTKVLTLKESRMVFLHQLGMRDFYENRDAICPVFITDADERAAYFAGHRGATRRALARQIANNPSQTTCN